MIGAIYDDCVRPRDVYTVLDDGRRNENIIFVVDEVEHDSLHLFFVHLSMTNGQPRLWHQTLDKRGDGLDCFDSIMDEENLAASRELQFNCGFDNTVRELHNLSLNRQPI